MICFLPFLFHCQKHTLKFRPKFNEYLGRKRKFKTIFSFQCDFKKLSNLLRFFEINLIIFLIRLFIITQSMYKKIHFLNRPKLL